uniref:PAP2_C domain-containing protein n=1 Tax=Rhabditophanes sp. KR3021 TaxID=114890 RepID=A0AC35TVI3_9BILA
MLVDKDTNILEDYYKRSNIKKFPTFVALLSLIFGWLLNIITLAWVHDRVPMDRAPLPDLFFSIFPEIPEAIRITQIIMLFMIVNCLVVIYLHQHRWIVARRVFFCVAVSYVFRAICITIFQVPVPST